MIRGIRMTHIRNIFIIFIAVILLRSNDLISKIIKLVIILLPLLVLVSVISTCSRKKNNRKTRKKETIKDIAGIGTVIGIDLGTINTRVAVYANDQVKIIANDHGYEVTPSCVSFTATGKVLVGENAKSQLTTNPENTISNIQRIMGRQCTDMVVERNIKNYPFNITEESGQLFIKVQTAEGEKTFAPELISAMIIGHMKETAEKHLVKKVTHVIASVPANFNDAQKRATETAFTISGLKISRMISAPNAAAVAYFMDKKKTKTFWTKFWVNVQPSKQEGKKIVLVFDLGGGHFDVSLISIDNANGDNRVLSTHGDTNLGGEDFNHRVLDYYVELYQKNTGRDIRQDKKAIEKLRIKVEEAKKILSDRNEVKLIESLIENDDFAETLTREMFENFNEDLFMRTLDSVEKVLRDAKLSKTDVNEIILAGGSSRIPKIQQLLKNFFGGKELCPINDEAVISGITVQTSNVTGGENVAAAIKLQDVTPLSLGIQHGNGWMNTIIPKNTVIPTESYISTGTMRDYQTSVIITIYEGESSRTKDNHLLGEFELNGIRSAPSGEVAIGITLKLDSSGILHVSAIEEGSDNKGQITIAYDHRRRRPQDIEKMIIDFKKYTEDGQ